MPLKKKETIGETLLKLRNTKKLTRQEVVKGSGVSLAHLKRIEAGTVALTFKQMTKLAWFYKIQINLKDLT